MLNVFYSARFKRDYKRLQRQRRDIDALFSVIDTLAHEKRLAEKFCDHALTGNLKGHRECHIEPDWLLIYKIDNNHLVLTLTRTGSHSELLGK